MSSSIRLRGLIKGWEARLFYRMARSDGTSKTSVSSSRRTSASTMGGLCPRLNTLSSSDIAFDYRENRALVLPQTPAPIKQPFRQELPPPSHGIVIAPLSRLSVERKQASGYAGGRCSHWVKQEFLLIVFFLHTNEVLGGFFGQLDYKSMSIYVRFRRMSCNNINPINMNRK